jgi:hypothetical protein
MCRCFDGGAGFGGEVAFQRRCRGFWGWRGVHPRLRPVGWSWAIFPSPLIRLKLSELADALAALRQLVGEYLPEAGFGQRARGEAIGRGLLQVATVPASSPAA